MKTVSSSAYFWGHLATIVFHVIIASLLISIYFKGNNWGMEKVRTISVSAGSVLLAVSLLSLVPILRYRKNIQIT
jgi:hypothetical protein